MSVSVLSCKQGKALIGLVNASRRKTPYLGMETPRSEGVNRTHVPRSGELVDKPDKDVAYLALLTAARAWRDALIPGTSSAAYPETRKLLAEIAKHDPEPCQHPRGWRVQYVERVGQPAQEICAKCTAVLVPGEG